MKYPGKQDKKSKNDMKTISTGVEKSEGKFSKKKIDEKLLIRVIVSYQWKSKVK